MRHCLYIVLLILVGVLTLSAQEEAHPQRTAYDIACKQTGMLVRELNIVDSMMRDTLFKMHLKYAQKRHQSITRAEALQCMHHMINELKSILAPELFEQFMNRHISGEPRSPQHTCNWGTITQSHSHHEDSLPRAAATHTLTSQPNNPPPNHQ